jgi:hypothetical protein
MTITQNRDGHTENPGQPSHHNPSCKPMNNPSSSGNESAGERASALNNGAPARPPLGKQPEPRRAVQERTGGAAPPPHSQLNPHAEQQRFDRELTEIICEQYWLLPDDQRDELRDDWSKGKLSADDVRAKF